MYSKGVNPVLTSIPLEHIEKECRAAVESYSYTKPIVFHYSFSDASLIADANLLSLALQNFIFNAIDAIEQSDDEIGEVWIGCEEEDRFTIEDSGVEIEESERLFEAFYTTKTKGNGLGMVLARQIVEAHNGRIVVETEPKRFTIFLPKRGGGYD